MVPTQERAADGKFAAQHAAHDAQTDALLAEIMADDAADDAESTEGEEPTEETAEETTETVADASEEQNSTEAGDVAASDDSEPGSPKETDHELETARQRLQLTGITTAVLDRMTREETVEAWSNRATYQAEIDRAFRERAELKTRLDTLGATNGTEPATAEPTESEDFKKAQVRLTEVLGDEEAEAVMAIVKNGGQAVTPSGASSPLVEELLRERMMAELGASDPRLRDRATFDGVEQVANQLNEGGFHSELVGLERIRALLQTAVRLKLPDPPSEAELERKQKVDLQRDRGSSTRSSKPHKQKSLSADQVLDAKILAIENGASVEEVRKRFGG